MSRNGPQARRREPPYRDEREDVDDYDEEGWDE